VGDRAGASMAFVGYAILVVVAAATLLAGADVLLNVRLVGAAAVLVGSILLGIMTIRARVVPWWCGVLIIVGFPLEAVMHSIRNGLGMRETEIAKEPTRPWNPHFYAVFARVHNTL
jgi:hypothetical protein